MTQPHAGPKNFLAAMILLTAITWMVGLLDLQFKAEANIGFSTGFPGPISEWVPTGAVENITVTNDVISIDRHAPNRSYAMRTFALPAQAELKRKKLRIRGVIKTLAKASPVMANKTAAYMIWFQDENQDTFRYLNVQALTGDFSTYRAERVVNIPDRAHYFSIVLINRDSDGSFALTDASVTLVSTSLMHFITTSAIFGLWATLLLIATVWVVRHGTWRLGVTICLLITLTFVGIWLPQSLNAKFVLPALKNFAAYLTLETTTPLGFVYKIGHFLFFFAATICLLISSRSLRLSTILVIGMMMVFAVATEGIQLHLFNRSTRLLDLGIDLSGVLLAWMVATGLFANSNASNMDSAFAPRNRK